jgi:hypothetical protein
VPGAGIFEFGVNSSQGILHPESHRLSSQIDNHSAGKLQPPAYAMGDNRLNTAILAPQERGLGRRGSVDRRMKNQVVVENPRCAVSPPEVIAVHFSAEGPVFGEYSHETRGLKVAFASPFLSNNQISGSICLTPTPIFTSCPIRGTATVVPLLRPALSISSAQHI